jgi:hypothetical protein
MNEDMFTLNDERTIQEMLDDYDKLKEEVALLPSDVPKEELTEKQSQLLDDYEQNRDFLNHARNALDFTRASTVNIVTGDAREGNTQVQSLYKDADEYSEAVTTLTAGFDDRLSEAMESTRETPVYKELEIPVGQFNSIANAPLNNPEISQMIDEKLPDKEADVLTVGEMVAVIDYTNQLFSEYDIREDSVLKDTMDEIQLNIEFDKANMLSEERYEHEAEHSEDKEHNGDDEVVIVESWGGYVMNTSEEITAENYHEVSSKIENGNEVVHNEPPRYTTNDLSEVGGNIELEEVDDLGTIEEAQGVLSEEEQEQQEQDNSDYDMDR